MRGCLHAIGQILAHITQIAVSQLADAHQLFGIDRRGRRQTRVHCQLVYLMFDSHLVVQVDHRLAEDRLALARIDLLRVTIEIANCLLEIRDL